MLDFTSDPTDFTETLEVTVSYIGGQYKNYIKPSQEITSVVYVKQSGVDISYSLEDIDGDGLLEIVVGDADETILIKYNYVGGEDTYSEAQEVTVYNPTGAPDNYITVSNYPILSITQPATGEISGVSNEIIKVGSLTGKISAQYSYDAGDLGTMASANLDKTEENTDLEDSIESLYSSKEKRQKEVSLYSKLACYYYLGYESIYELLSEKQYYQDEFDTRGSWQFLDDFPYDSKWYYYSGNSSIFSDRILKEIEINKRELSALALEGIKSEVEVVREVLTIQAPASGNFKDANVLEKAIDGQTDINSAFQTDNLNPITIYIQVSEPIYFTRLRINSTPEYILQNILSIKLSDSQFEDGTEILSEIKQTTNEWVDIDCVQRFKDSSNVTSTDNNDQELIYLLKKQWVQITMSRDLSNDVWVNEVELYKADYDSDIMTYADKTYEIYLQNVSDSLKNYGPNIGFDTNPPTGRVTWMGARFSKTLTDAPSGGGANSRQYSIDQYLDLSDTKADIDTISAEGDANYINSKRKFWRDQYEESINKRYSIQNSINNIALEVTNNKSEISEYDRYI
jgi:hypothetical protein